VSDSRQITDPPKQVDPAARALWERAERSAARGEGADAVAARARFVDRAHDEGLVDVAYAPADSPLGELLVAVTPRGVVRVAYIDEQLGRDEVLEDLARRVSPRVLEAPAHLDEARRQLDDYFGGRRAGFELAVDLSLVAPFTDRVLTRTAAIPPGEVLTYGEVATEIGHARAARAVGNALGSNPIPIVVPCHRVVRSGGALGGYTGGTHRKEHLLGLERGGTPSGAGRPSSRSRGSVRRPV
jgi:methylated-DNA-[protein]-cysteine S-methyltransferase